MKESPGMNIYGISVSASGGAGATSGADWSASAGRMKIGLQNNKVLIYSVDGEKAKMEILVNGTA